MTKRQVLERLATRVFTRTELEGAERRGLRMEAVGAIVNFSTAGGTQEWELFGQLFGAGRVPLMMAPGLAALGNKVLLPFMDEIVAFYPSADPSSGRQKPTCVVR